MDKKKTNISNSVTVECPFCNKAIEVPAKPDIILECPHCHKELITYDKKEIIINDKKEIFTESKTDRHSSYSGSSQNDSEIVLSYLLISFLIPFIGIILCCTSWNKHDGKAQSALIGTLVGIIFTALILLSL